MNQICIAKKVSANNVEFLDFAVDDNDRLLVFPNFKVASEFLKADVGVGEQLLDFIITTTEAQSGNPRMQELLRNPVSEPYSEPELPEVLEGFEEVECTFLLHCSDFDIKDHEVFGDKLKNRVLSPCLVFVDVTNPNEPVPVENFTLKAVYIDRLKK